MSCFMPFFFELCRRRSSEDGTSERISRRHKRRTHSRCPLENCSCCGGICQRTESYTPPPRTRSVSVRPSDYNHKYSGREQEEFREDNRLRRLRVRREKQQETRSRSLPSEVTTRVQIEPEPRRKANQQSGPQQNPERKQQLESGSQQNPERKQQLESGSQQNPERKQQLESDSQHKPERKEQTPRGSQQNPSQKTKQKIESVTKRYCEPDAKLKSGTIPTHKPDRTPRQPPSPRPELERRPISVPTHRPIPDALRLPRTRPVNENEHAPNISLRTNSIFIRRQFLRHLAIAQPFRSYEEEDVLTSLRKTEDDIRRLYYKISSRSPSQRIFRHKRLIARALCKCPVWYTPTTTNLNRIEDAARSNRFLLPLAGTSRMRHREGSPRPRQRILPNPIRLEPLPPPITQQIIHPQRLYQRYSLLLDSSSAETQSCSRRSRLDQSLQRSIAEQLQLGSPPNRRALLLRQQLLRSRVVSSQDNNIAQGRSTRRQGRINFLLHSDEEEDEVMMALPQHGHKHWQFYFSRTFDVYTKLWKYQQQHRHLLNEEYGLRRWQIGEIASKIGQLYYHFYLRTSEVTYLFDAYEFYSAIRMRGYYAKAADETNGDLMIKRLRYYTRFIVVSLLTRKLKFVQELISELDDVIMEYGDSYDPEDQIQWTMVSSEVKAFLAVECAIIIEDPECKKSLRTKTRLTPVSIPCIDKTPQMNLRLQKAVIIGSGSYQAKVSELTIDMYRILQTIEREPVKPREVWEEPRNPFADGFERAYNIELATANAPEKNLLFKPSPTQALVYIASACEDLSPIGALLIYISADGVSPNNKGGEDYGFDTGGLITTSKSDIYGEVRASAPARYKEIQCLHPGDLQPFTRKPLFLIVDSDHSTIFLKMRRPFEMPMVILMSPTEFPSSLKEYENMGGLLTLFLYCPLGAVCRICSVNNVSADIWVEAQILINNFLQEAVGVAVRLPLDSSYICFLGDDFLRVQITRYIFCEMVLRMHRSFVSRNHLPRTSPSLPEQLFENLTLTEMVLELATFLKIRHQFYDPLASGGPSN